MLSDRMPPKHILITGILIIAVCTLACFSQPAKTSASPDVVSYSTYRDALNYSWVFGEAKNTGNTPATNITINASFYDSSDNLVNSSSTMIEGSYGPGKSMVLLPGAKAPFYMFVLPQEGTANFDHCGFAVLFEESASKNVGFQIANSSCGLNLTSPFQNVDANCVIRNAAATVVQERVNIYLTLYNSTGTVIGQAYTQEEVNLRPGEVAASFFQVTTPYPAQAANYTVTAQSANYSVEAESDGVVKVIPEFQSFFILPLLTTASLLTAVLYRKKSKL